MFVANEKVWVDLSDIPGVLREVFQHDEDFIEATILNDAAEGYVRVAAEWRSRGEPGISSLFVPVEGVYRHNPNITNVILNRVADELSEAIETITGEPMPKRQDVYEERAIRILESVVDMDRQNSDALPGSAVKHVKDAITILKKRRK